MDRIKERVRERYREGEIQERRLAFLRRKGEHPEQIPGVEGGGNKEQRRQRSKDRLLESGNASRDQDENRRQHKSEQNPGEKGRVEKGEDRLSPGRVMEPLLENEKLGLGPLREIRSLHQPHGPSIERRVEAPACRVLRHAACRRNSGARRREPEADRRERKGHAQRRAPAPKDGNRASQRDVLRQNRQREGDTGDGPAIAGQMREGRQKQDRPERVQMPLSRRFGDGQRMKGIEGRPENCAGATGACQQRHDRQIGRGEDRLETHDPAAAKDTKDSLRGRRVDRADVAVGQRQKKPWRDRRHGGIVRGISVWGDARPRHPAVPEIAMRVLGEVRRP